MFAVTATTMTLENVMPEDNNSPSNYLPSCKILSRCMHDSTIDFLIFKVNLRGFLFWVKGSSPLIVDYCNLLRWRSYFKDYRICLIRHLQLLNFAQTFSYHTSSIPHVCLYRHEETIMIIMLLVLKWRHKSNQEIQ